MSEYGTVLGRVERRVLMPEPAMDRLLRRRDRRLRNQRIAAGAVGLVVALAGIGFGVLALPGGRVGRPASGELPSPSPGGDGVVGIVLPTVAVWIALAVLGLTGLAIARLRRRPVEAPMSGSTRRERSRQGHGPATETRTPRGKGGNEMDSRQKTGAGVSRAEMPEIRFDDGKLHRTNLWLIGAVVVLAVALVAVGTWAIVDRSGGEQQAAPPPMPSMQIEVADPAIVELIDDLDAALGVSGERFASFFTEDAVFEERTEAEQVTVGRANIARQVQYYIGLGWHGHRVGEVAQWGSFAAYANVGPEGFSGMTILELTPEGRISHSWNFGDYRR